MASATDFPKATERLIVSGFSLAKVALIAFSSESIAARSVAFKFDEVKKLLLNSAREAFTLAGQLYFSDFSVSGRFVKPLYCCFQESNPGSVDSYALMPE